MKIDGVSAQDIYKCYQNGPRKSDGGQSAAEEKRMDHVEISTQASDLKDAESLRDRSSGENDTAHAARLAEVKNKIDSGTYNVSAKDVAVSIAKGIHFDRRV